MLAWRQMGVIPHDEYGVLRIVVVPLRLIVLATVVVALLVWAAWHVRR